MHDLPIQDAAERAGCLPGGAAGVEANGGRSRTRWTCGARAGSGLRTRSGARRCRRASRTRRRGRGQWRRKSPRGTGSFIGNWSFRMCSDEAGAGFDAVVGNPPWDIAKPVSMEFFSNIDPLYRSYGKQEALRKQTEYFARRNRGTRVARLLRGLPRPVELRGPGAQTPSAIPRRRRRVRTGSTSERATSEFHRRWRDARRRSTGFADPQHPFQAPGIGRPEPLQALSRGRPTCWPGSAWPGRVPRSFGALFGQRYRGVADPVPGKRV